MKKRLAADSGIGRLTLTVELASGTSEVVYSVVNKRNLLKNCKLTIYSQGAISKCGGRRRWEGVVIHRRYSDGPLWGSRHDLVVGHEMTIRWSLTLQPPGNVGGVDRLATRALECPASQR